MQRCFLRVAFGTEVFAQGINRLELRAFVTQSGVPSTRSDPGLEAAGKPRAIAQNRSVTSGGREKSYMSNIRIDTILMVVLFVVTSGFAMSQIFEQLKRPYLITFSGSRMRLLTARMAVWSMAILVSFGFGGILFVVLPGFAALPIFFAFEAIVLDLCTQRVQYERLPELELSPVRRNVSGAF